MSGPAKEGEESSDGCLLRGCLGVLLVGVLLAMAFGWGAYTLYQQVMELTSTEPAEVPAFSHQPQEWESFQQQWEAASQDWLAGRPATLRVSAADLNNLIQQNLPADGTTGRYFVEIKDGAVWLQTSVPLDWIDGYQGRYFNGKLEMVPKIEGERFMLEVKSIQSAAGSAPPQFMQTQRYFDWAAWLDKLGLRQPLDQLDSIEIKDGALILRKGPAEAKVQD